MHGDRHEIYVSCLLSVFFALTVHKISFFRDYNQLNLSIKLCATYLRARAKQKQKTVHCHDQFNINCDNSTLAFVGFKGS